ncbi:hypothetical protein N431DRAFT_491492 [Stipitochalara longipes BDJ]|nr:hypothetical protein N431DRAFT_491492 [Stipitochalara longipes BDJ]
MARLHLLFPSLICGGILLGTWVAIAHHLFYQSLNGKIVHSDDQQQWSLRIGMGFAFLTKTFLTASASLGYIQLLWQTLRSSPISIDSLFGAVNNAWYFTDLELWRRGPALAIITLIVWTLPLIAVVTPATLTVHPAAKLNQTVHHLPIPSIDYGIVEDQTFAFINPAGATSYEGPTPRIIRLLSSVVSQGSILQITAPYPNCTYFVPFYGPSISCDAALAGLKMTLDDPYSIQISDNSFTTINEAGLASISPGATATESNGAFPASAYETIECGLYNTSYVVNFTFNNGRQEVIVTNMTQLNGVSSWAWYNLCSYDWGPCAGPGMAYNSIIDALGNILIGYLAIQPYGDMASTRTQIMSTVLIETTDLQGNLRGSPSNDGLREQMSIANMTLSEALEQIVLNTTLSLFSDSYFLQNSTTASILPVLVSTPQNAYVYSSRNLFVAYGLGISIATVIVLVGIVCIWASENSFGASFSTILRTTRNIQLDAIVPAKETQGAFPLPEKLGKTKLILRQRGMRTAFTVVDDDGGDGEEMETMRPSASRQMSSDSLLQSKQIDATYWPLSQ